MRAVGTTRAPPSRSSPWSQWTTPSRRTTAGLSGTGGPTATYSLPLRRVVQLLEADDGAGDDAGEAGAWLVPLAPTTEIQIMPASHCATPPKTTRPGSVGAAAFGA